MTYHDVVSLMGPRDDGNITDEQRAATTDPAETNSVPLDEAMQEDIAPSSIIPRGPSFLAMKRMQTEIRRKKKRLHQLVPEAYVSLVKHDEGVYTRWEEYYQCCCCTELQRCWLLPNQKPCSSEPAEIPLVPLVDIRYSELHQMAETSERNETWPMPIILDKLIPKFLARVHPLLLLALKARQRHFPMKKTVLSNILPSCLSTTKLA